MEQFSHDVSPKDINSVLLTQASHPIVLSIIIYYTNVL